jgi:hypothetical protein
LLGSRLRRLHCNDCAECMGKGTAFDRPREKRGLAMSRNLHPHEEEAKASKDGTIPLKVTHGLVKSANRPDLTLATIYQPTPIAAITLYDQILKDARTDMKARGALVASLLPQPLVNTNRQVGSV